MKSVGISFIIPIFNAEHTIVETVESIFANNISSSDEIILVNDGSTDNSTDVINELIKNHKIIKVINHQNNKGGGAARNQLIFCLDSDNVLSPFSVPRLKNFMLRNDYDAASFKEVYFFKNSINKISHKSKYNYDFYDYSNYLSTMNVPGSSGNYLYKKSSWLKAKRYPEESMALDTWGFGLRQVMSGFVIGTMPNSHYFHRFGHNSYWVRESNKYSMSLIAIQLIIPFIDKLSSRDVNYIFSKKGRLSWLDNLEKRPIATRDHSENLINSYFERVNDFFHI